MSSGIQEIEDFEPSLALNTIEKTIETADSTTSAKKSCKTSPIHEHCRTPTLDERNKRLEIK